MWVLMSVFVAWYLSNREREIRGKYFSGLSFSGVSLAAEALLELTDPVNFWSLVNTGRIFARVREILLAVEIRLCPETFRLLGLDFEPAEDDISISTKKQIYPLFLIPISLKLFLGQHLFLFYASSVSSPPVIFLGACART